MLHNNHHSHLIKISKDDYKDPISFPSFSFSNSQISHKPFHGVSTNVSLKYASLIVLILQNSALVLFLRFSRLSPSPDGRMYIPSTAVFLMEICKMIVSLLAIFIQNKLSISATAQFLNQYIFSSPRDSFKLFVPAVLFALQNNLLYIALSNLNATVYQVSYQVKILTTALFSVWMLKKHLTISKWIALILLAVGVVIVQLTQHHTSPKKINGIHQNHLLGLSAVLISAVSSGYAGCYFERVLKNSESSLWIRNIQLGIFSLLFAIPTMWFDSSDIIKYGFFSGYTNLTWLVIFNQALGGIVVAMVVRYADNILKSFSTSVSILLSCCIDFAFFGFVPTHFFVIGAGVVLVAVFMYAID